MSPRVEFDDADGTYLFIQKIRKDQGNMAVQDTIRDQLQDLADKAKDENQHDIRLEALRKLSEKPGVQTTEFYLSLACVTIGGILSAIPERALLGAILIAIGTLSYNLSRGIAKKVGMLFLAASLVFGMGCQTKGYVRADAIKGTVKRIRARHDAYVNADKSYDDPASPNFGKRDSDLRDTKLVDETLDEATTPAATPAK